MSAVMNEAPSSPEAAASPLPLGGVQPSIFSTSPAMRLTPVQAVELGRIAAPFFARVFSDGAGNPSSLRLIFVLGFAAVAGAWAYLSIRIGALQEIPMTVILFLATLMGGKLWQNQQEPDAPAPLRAAFALADTNLSGAQPGAEGSIASPSASTSLTTQTGASSNAGTKAQGAIDDNRLESGTYSRNTDGPSNPQGSVYGGKPVCPSPSAGPAHSNQTETASSKTPGAAAKELAAAPRNPAA